LAEGCALLTLLTSSEAGEGESTGLPLLEKTCDDGEATACSLLGLLEIRGAGVEKDVAGKRV
jgi:TPR repeat protein